jgi:HSP20 family protein
MSDIIVRRHNADRPTNIEPAASWDPWRTMRALMSWDPFREMATFPALPESGLAFNAAFDVKETKDAYLFRADLPGIKDKDLEVTMTGNRLNVSGKREEEKEEKSDRYYTYERNYGSFSRSFTLPDGADVDKLRASLDQGVLTISVPKKPRGAAKEDRREVRDGAEILTRRGSGRRGARRRAPRPLRPEACWSRILNLSEAIRARRAVRSYSSRTVDEDTVRSLLDAAV